MALPATLHPHGRTQSVNRGSAPLALLLLALAGGIPGADGANSASVGARVFPAPLEVTLTVSPTQIGAEETARAAAVVTNVGPERVRDVSLELRGDPTGLRVTGRNPRRFSGLPSGAGADAQWLACGRNPATYVLVAQARAKLPSGVAVAAESAARLLTVTGPPACR